MKDRRGEVDKDTKRLNQIEEEYENSKREEAARLLNPEPKPRLDVGFEGACWVQPEFMKDHLGFEILAHAKVSDYDPLNEVHVCEIKCPVPSRLHERGDYSLRKSSERLGFEELFQFPLPGEVDITRVLEGEIEGGPLCFAAFLAEAPLGHELFRGRGERGKLELFPHTEKRGSWSASFSFGGRIGVRTAWSEEIGYDEENGSLWMLVDGDEFLWTVPVFLPLDSELSRILLWEGGDETWSVYGGGMFHRRPHVPPYQGQLYFEGDVVSFFDTASGKQLKGTVLSDAFARGYAGKRERVYKVAIENELYYPNECDIDWPTLGRNGISDSPFATLEDSRFRFYGFSENCWSGDNLLFEITRSDWTLDEERESYLPHCVLKDVFNFSISEDLTGSYIEPLLEVYFDDKLPENIRSRSEDGHTGICYEHYFENFYSIRTFRRIVREAETRLILMEEARRRDDIEWLESLDIFRPNECGYVVDLRKPGEVTRGILFYERFVAFSKRMLKDLKAKQEREGNRYPYVVRITGP